MAMEMAEVVAVEQAATTAPDTGLEQTAPEQVASAAGGAPVELSDDIEPAGTGDAGAQEAELAQAEPAEPAWRGASAADKLAYAAQLLGMDEDTLLEELLARQEGAAAGWQAFSRQMAAQADQALTARLAAEFEQLCQLVPDVTAVDQLPPSVWETAVAEGIPLTDAYLRFWYGEQQKAVAEARRQQENAAGSAGSLSGVYEPPQVEQEAFNRAFWG